LISDEAYLEHLASQIQDVQDTPPQSDER